MKKTQKFLIAGIVIASAISYLIYVGVKESGVYFMTVSELKTSTMLKEGEGLRISGSVIEGSITQETKELILRFKIRDEDEEGGEKGDDNIFVNVYYKGVKPDSFKADVQVILEGKYNKAENLFKATTLLVKCPSRYEGETPPEEHDYSTGGKRLDDEPAVEEKPLAD